MMIDKLKKFLIFNFFFTEFEKNKKKEFKKFIKTV